MLALRPERVQVAPAPLTGLDNRLPGTVEFVSYLGALIDILYDTAGRFPDAPALDDGEVQLTYAELISDIEESVEWLAARGNPAGKAFTRPNTVVLLQFAAETHRRGQTQPVSFRLTQQNGA